MGRLWQTLILSDWNPLFAWLPVESIVKDRQEGYYRALQQADNAADSTSFVTFMLKALSDALDEVASRGDDVGINVGINDGTANAAIQAQGKLLTLMEANPTITAAQLAERLSLSKRQVERLIASLKAEGRLVRIGANRNGRWEVR